VHYRLRCECGNDLSVTEGAAGVSLPCACGRSILVPAFAELRRRAASGDLPCSLYGDDEEPPKPPSPAAETARTVVRGLLFAVGGLVFLVGVGLFLGNITGLLRTMPFAGYFTMTVGLATLGAAARATA
jgi:hypothetical protein